MQKIKQVRFSGWILLAALLAVGSFHEYISCALSVAMLSWLAVRMHRTKKLSMQLSLPALAVVAVCAGYGVTCFWAVDRGMAFVGFLKFLPLCLYLLCLWQEDGESALQLLPWAGGAMALLSAVGMQIPYLQSLFAVAGRLAGFFQYPNTFAAFLLICQLLVLKKTEKKIWDYLLMAILVAAILYTGSRAVFVLLVLSNAAMLLMMGKKKLRMALLLAAGIVCLVGVLLLLDKDSVLSRYLSISLRESTFVGRILYWQDALPLLIKYPFGMGYMGYSYMQSSIQTGVYSATYIHNDFLQLFLDVGWIPGLLLLGGIISWLLRADAQPGDKLIVATLCAHCLFDFDLQFVGMFLLLLTLMHPKGKTVDIKAGAIWKGAVALLAVVSLYMGSALALAHWGQRETAEKLYPFNTQNKLRLLEAETDLSRANVLAEQILAQNTQYYVPYSIKSKLCYSQGDFTGLIQNKRLVLEKHPFGYEEYEEYCTMLLNGYFLYQKNGDSKSADICRQELIRTWQLLKSTAGRLSKLGSMIDDQPRTELPESLQEQIRRLEAQK